MKSAISFGFVSLLTLVIFSTVLGQNKITRPRLRSTGAPGIHVPFSASHPIHLTAIDDLVDGKLNGVANARMICNERAYHAKRNSEQWRSGNWRAVISTRLQSLWSLVMYHHERINSSIVNLAGDVLWPSWNDFVDGKVSESIQSGVAQIETFEGKNLLDVFTTNRQTQRYAWLGYTPDSEYRDSGIVNASSPHCDNWMTLRGMGPAVNLDKLMSTGSIGDDSIELKPCSSKFALLCVERAAPGESGGFTYSMYGKDLGRNRGKAQHPNARKFKRFLHGTTMVIDRRRRTTRHN